MKFKLDVKSRYAHKFQKIGYSNIIPFAYVGKEEIHKQIKEIKMATKL